MTLRSIAGGSPAPAFVGTPRRFLQSGFEDLRLVAKALAILAATAVALVATCAGVLVVLEYPLWKYSKALVSDLERLDGVERASGGLGESEQEAITHLTLAGGGAIGLLLLSPDELSQSHACLMQIGPGYIRELTCGAEPSIEFYFCKRPTWLPAEAWPRGETASGFVASYAHLAAAVEGLPGPGSPKSVGENRWAWVTKDSYVPFPEQLKVRCDEIAARAD